NLGRVRPHRQVGTDPTEQYVVPLPLHPPGGRIVRVVDVYAQLYQVDPGHGQLFAQALTGGGGGRLSRCPMAAGGIGPAQREPGLRRGPALEQQPPGRILQQHRERAVHQARSLVRVLHCGLSTCDTVGVDQFYQVPLARRGRRGRRGHDRYPVTRWAASFPEISTIGTPTPGWVPEPTNTTLDSTGCRLPG